MKINTTLALTVRLPEKATSKIKPAPSKNEIIEAMVQLRREERDAKAAEAVKTFKTAKEKAIKLFLAEFKRNRTSFGEPSINFGNLNHGQKSSEDKWWRTPEVTFGMMVASDELQTALEEYHKSVASDLLDYNGKAKDFNHEAARKEIKALLDHKLGSSTSSRVTAMLKSPAIRTALEQSLADLTNPNKPAATEAIAA